jgi:hypothetical protein
LIVLRAHRSCRTPHGLLRSDPCEDAGLPEAEPERSTDHRQFVRIAYAALAGQIVDAGFFGLEKRGQLGHGQKFIVSRCGCCRLLVSQSFLAYTVLSLKRAAKVAVEVARQRSARWSNEA